MLTPIRDDHGSLNMIFPVNGLFPESCCPHGVRIYDGDVCSVLHCMSKHTARAVERTNPPPPIDPEDRLNTRIRHWQAVLEVGDQSPQDVLKIRSRITALRKELEEWTGKPTVYAPEHPGGKGDLKAKGIWELRGLDFTVQAWDKAGAVREFSHRLRAQGEKGRFSVPISNPKRVKTA